MRADDLDHKELLELDLEGLFRIEPGGTGPLSRTGSMVVASYEAEQHLLHFGRSEVPVRWTICGLTSGYLSRIAGEDTYHPGRSSRVTIYYRPIGLETEHLSAPLRPQLCA